MADNEFPIAVDVRNWLHEAIEAGMLDRSSAYVGLDEAQVQTLADSAFGDRPLLIRLRSNVGDGRIVRDAEWLLVWCAAADPEEIPGAHGVFFLPDHLRDVFPLDGVGTADPT